MVLDLVGRQIADDLPQPLASDWLTRPDVAALLEPRVPGDGHPGEQRHLLATQALGASPAPFGPTLQAAGLHSSELKPQLRALLHYHCGVNTLRTRQLMMDLQAL